ncbi:MAG: NAD(P)H-dependent oxidoreductase subunit E, partial [Thermofilum sp.]|nr:NAD(P)H-dependent oxidoreductase subunit E [Thermofilum sp.]
LGLKAGRKTTEDRMFSVEEARCFGCCGLAPVVVVQKPDGSNEIVGRANPRTLRALIERYRRQERGGAK